MAAFQPKKAEEIEAKLTDREREIIRVAVAEAISLIRESYPGRPELAPVAPISRELNISAANGRLTKTQVRVLELLLAGHSNKTAAQVMNISSRTVDVHRRQLMERLGVRQLTDIWLLAYTSGIAKPTTK